MFDFQPCADLCLPRIQPEIHNCHGWYRAYEVGVDDAEKRFRYFRKFIIDFQMDPGGQESECFQEPLHVWIFAFLRLQIETRCDFGILFRELRTHAPQKTELAFIVQQQIVAQVNCPLSDIPRYSVEAPCQIEPVPGQDPF